MDVAEVWRQHRRWSIVTSRADRFLRRWRSVNLGLIVAGSVLGALATQGTWSSRTVTVTWGSSARPCDGPHVAHHGGPTGR